MSGYVLFAGSRYSGGSSSHLWTDLAARSVPGRPSMAVADHGSRQVRRMAAEGFCMLRAGQGIYSLDRPCHAFVLAGLVLDHGTVEMGLVCLGIVQLVAQLDAHPLEVTPPPVTAAFSQLQSDTLAL